MPDPLQTIDRPTSTPGGPPPWTTVALVAAGVLTLPLLLLSIFTKWGVLIAVSVAVVIGLAIWVWQRGFVFVEIVAFLIHFDGLGAGPIRTGRVVAGVAALVLIVKLVQGWRPPAIPLRHWGPIWALTIWAVFSGLWSAEVGGWFFTLGMYGLGLAFFCITGLFVDSHRMVQQFLRAYWVGGLFGSAAGILALFLGTRSVGFGSDPNFFGLLQASMIPLTVYYRRHAVTPQAKWLYTVAVVVVLAGAAGAGSRSGLIGGALAIVGTMVTRPGLRPARRAMVSVSAVVLAGIAFLVGFIVNPNNLQRGFSDRGAGRLDLWNVSVSLIRENPVWGYGFGQLRSLVPPNLLVTPGSQRLSEFRTDVSAHNTWLDVMGDLGVFGLMLFLSVFVIAIVGFARPRWLHTKELSTTLFVMMLPVLSGSFFLPLLNNKLAWALIGLSAALQVPSAEARWSGLARAMGTAGPAPGALGRGGGAGGPTPLGAATTGSALVAASGLPASSGGPRGATLPVVPRRPGERPEAPGEEVWEPVELARWDLAVTRRARWAVVATSLATAVLFAGYSGSQQTSFTASAGVIVPRVDGSLGRDRVKIERERIQTALTLGISGAYAQELIERAGLDQSVEEVRERLDAGRPRMGSYVEISYTDTDRARVESVMVHLKPTLDAVFAEVQAASLGQTQDELRPVIPGESRIYTGPAYLDSFAEPGFDEQPPRTVWYGFVGAFTGGLLAAGVVLAGQRRPRLAATDDVRRHVGVPVWAHVGGGSRRNAPTRDQYSQALATAAAVVDGEPRHLVVAPARHCTAARQLAVGLAAEVVALGGRAVVVDGDVRRPLLTARLGGLGRPGLRDVGRDVELAQVIRRVHPLRLFPTPRRMVGASVENLRAIPAGRWRRRPVTTLPLAALDRLDPDVTIIVLAPPLLDGLPTAALLGWADAVVVPAAVGRTATVDLEDAVASTVQCTTAPVGVVLTDG